MTMQRTLVVTLVHHQPFQTRLSEPVALALRPGDTLTVEHEDYLIESRRFATDTEGHLTSASYRVTRL